MKKYYIVFVLLIGIFLTNKIIYAEEVSVKEKDTETSKVTQIVNEDLRTQLNIRREKTEEKTVTNREVLRLKLQEIKNERKQNSVLNISDNIEKINIVATNRLTTFIENIEKVLTNIKNRTDQAEADQLDVSKVRIAIEDATEMINEAKTSIINQAGKNYIIKITNETELRQNVKTVRDTFHADVKAVQEEVKTAHLMVRDSIKALAEVISTVESEEEKGSEE